MRVILILLLLFTACKCPQLVLQNETTTEHKTDTVFLPGAIIEKTINLSYLCDSIYALKKEGVVSLPDLLTWEDEPIATKAEVKKGKLIISTPCPPTQVVHDSVMVKESKNGLLIKDRDRTGWEKFTISWFWITVAFIAGTLVWKFGVKKGL